MDYHEEIKRKPIRTVAEPTGLSASLRMARFFRSYTENKQAKCWICHKAMLKRTLARHMRTVHGSSSLITTSRYACSECEREFTRMDGLKRHIQRAHMGQPRRTHSRKYGGVSSCVYCEKWKGYGLIDRLCCSCNLSCTKIDVPVNGAAIEPIFLAVRYAIECSLAQRRYLGRTSSHAMVSQESVLGTLLALRNKAITAIAHEIETLPRNQAPPYALEMVLLAYPIQHEIAPETDKEVSGMLRSSQRQFLRVFARVPKSTLIFGSYSATMNRAMQLLEDENESNPDLRWLAEWVERLRGQPHDIPSSN